MKALTLGSLYAGIGGIDLGLERAGLRCAWQVEIDDDATRILEQHWPTVLRRRDVYDSGAHNLPWVDVIGGGFMCTDISNAGLRAGLDGERSGGTWREFARIVCELRPRYIVVENVAALLGRGMGAVLGTLSEIGYDAEWSVLSACALGAPHPRERLFIVAYTREISRAWWRFRERSGACPDGRATPVRAPDHLAAYGLGEIARWWSDQSPVGRVVDGVSRRLDRVGYLGNAVVPQCAELIGRYIMMIEEATQC